MEMRRVLKLFLASPTDTEAERRKVHDVVESWNRSVGAKRGWQVDVFDYTKNVSPAYGSDGQRIVNQASGNMRNYAFFVGILKHRFGTPTPRAASGTKEEFQRAVKAFKSTGRLEIMLYFSNAPLPKTDNANLTQKQKVNDFRTSVQGESFYKNFSSREDFQKQFNEHFASKMEDQIRAHAKALRRAPARSTSKSKTSAKPIPTQPKVAMPRAAAVSTPRPSKGKIKPATSAKPARPPAPRAPATVSTSGPWLLLDGHLFRHRLVKGSGSQLTLPLLSSNGEEESILRRLCNSQGYNLLSYAHGRDGGQVRLTSCEHETQGNSILWTFHASIDRTQRGGFMSSADIERNARLLLLGPSHEPSAPNSHPNLWAGAMRHSRTGHDAPGLFAALWDKMDGNRSEFLYEAFLHAVQRLKGDGLCEDVLELKLGPVKNKTLRVHFRGRMASSFSGSGQVIEIKGDCALITSKPPK